ncbi:hypothetical protein Z043_104428, partial [Scleropages formosus]
MAGKTLRRRGTASVRLARTPLPVLCSLASQSPVLQYLYYLAQVPI